MIKENIEGVIQGSSQKTKKVWGAPPNYQKCDIWTLILAVVLISL